VEKMMNEIVVRFENDYSKYYENCSMMVDKADGSVRIEKSSETIAHYNKDEFIQIIWEIR
jgi:hypothetical protein